MDYFAEESFLCYWVKPGCLIIRTSLKEKWFWLCFLEELILVGSLNFLIMRTFTKGKDKTPFFLNFPGVLYY